MMNLLSTVDTGGDIGGDTEKKVVIPTPGAKFIRIAGCLFIAAALAAMIFGVLGLMGIGVTDTFYLESAVTEARSFSANLDGVPMWTEDSWQSLQENLVAARDTLSNRNATQEQINVAEQNLRAAIDGLTPSEAFADMEVDEFISDGETVSAFFTYLIVLAFVLGACGFVAVKYCTEFAKARMLGVFGVISFAACAILIFFAVDTLGHEILWNFMPIMILPIFFIVGVFKNDRRISTIIIFSILVVLAMIVLFPLWWIIRTSLMYLHEVATMSFLPMSWRFENYPRALETFKYFTYLRNTFIIATPSVILGTCTAILCAYSFARLRFRFKKFVFGLCIASMLLPAVVTLIPLYIMFTNFFGLGNTFWPLIIPWVCGGGAFNIFLMRQFIMTIPRELDEAAMIDGCGRLRTLVQILLPSIKPAIMVVGIFIFMLIWNDLLTQLVYLQSEELHTMAIGLRVFTGSYGTEWHLTMVATILSIIPGLIIYLIGQKYLVEGIVMTGMKN